VLTSENLVADRIFYKQQSIQRSVADIFDRMLIGSGSPLMRVGIDETYDPNFNFVLFEEDFPQDASSFKTELQKYESFAETMLNESAVSVAMDLDPIGDRMAIGIEPYSIIYTHDPTWGDGSARQYKVIPSTSGAAYVNGYDIVVQLTGQWDVMPESANWTDFSPGSLRTNITIISDGGYPTYNDIQYIDKTLQSSFGIDVNTTAGGYQEAPINIVFCTSVCSLSFDMQSAEATVTTVINVTEAEGSTTAHLSEAYVSVTEIAYSIGKNSSVRIV
jgi:hypothetical protein